MLPSWDKIIAWNVVAVPMYVAGVCHTPECPRWFQITITICAIFISQTAMFSKKN